jgi:hypothetical protein
MSPVPTPILRDAGYQENLYRGRAMAELRILKQQMGITGLKMGSRTVDIGANVFVHCVVCFNMEDVRLFTRTSNGVVAGVVVTTTLPTTTTTTSGTTTTTAPGATTTTTTGATTTTTAGATTTTTTGGGEYDNNGHKVVFHIAQGTQQNYTPAFIVTNWAGAVSATVNIVMDDLPAQYDERFSFYGVVGSGDWIDYYMDGERYIGGVWYYWNTVGLGRRLDGSTFSATVYLSQLPYTTTTTTTTSP